MTESQEREHKRVRQACANCRRKKNRCSGERPVCAFCARLGQHCRYIEDAHSEPSVQAFVSPLPQENQRLAARVALLESRLRLLDPSCGDIGPDGQGSPALQTNTINTQQSAGSPRYPVESEFASLLDVVTLPSLAGVYFRYCHQQPYVYFNESTLRAMLHTESMPYYLLLAFAATAVRFSSDACFAGRQQAAMDSYSRMAWSEIMEQSFSNQQSLSISTVQAANLLGIIDFLAGRNQVAWVKIGLAVRLAQTLRLGEEPDPWLLSSEAEERRNTFWPSILLAIDCTVRLPVNPHSGKNAFGTSAPTLAIIQEIPDLPLLAKNDHFALTIFMVSILGYVSRWGFRQSAPSTRFPWDSSSELARIDGILLSFESYSDACNSNFVEVPAQHFSFNGVVDGAMSAHFIYSRIIYHVNQCLLHHPVLLRQHLQTFKTNVPVGFLREAILKSKDQAVHVAEILRAIQDHGYEAFPSFFGYAAMVAGVLLRLHATSPSCCNLSEAEAHWKSCLRCLEHKPVRWQSHMRMAKILRGFDPTLSLATSRLCFTLDRSPLEFDHEDLLWRMCDYNWLAHSDRSMADSNEPFPLDSNDSNVASMLMQQNGRTADFDLILQEAFSLEHALSNGTRLDQGSDPVYGV